MFFRTKAIGKDVFQGYGFKVLFVHQVENEVILAEFPHDLTAHTAGRELAFDDPILAAADGNGFEIPMAVVDRLEESGALGANSGSKGRVLNIAAVPSAHSSAAPTL